MQTNNGVILAIKLIDQSGSLNCLRQHSGINTLCSRFCSFYPRDAILARVFATATCLSVRPSHASIMSIRRKSWFLHHLV